MPRPPAPRFTFPALAVGVLAASTASILIRVADAPALALAFWRCALGALALAGFAVRARHAGGRLQPSQRRQLGLSGVLLAGHFACFITALSLTTVASTAVLVTMAPLFVGLGAARFLGEPPSRRTWAGIALATGGAAIVGVADLGDANLGGRALLGDGLAFAGAALVAGYLLIGRLARQRLPVSLYAGVVYAVAAAVLLVACLLTGAELSGYDRTTWLAIAGLVLGPQLLGHTVFNTVLSTVSATVVAVVVLAEPVASTTLAYFLLAETPSPLFWTGGPLILAGVWLTATKDRRTVADPVAPP